MRLILSLRVLSKAVRIIVFRTCLESGLHMLLSVFNSVKKHWTQTKLRQRMLQSESCLASTGCALSTTEDVENVPYSLLPQPIFSFKFENCQRSPAQLANCTGIGIDNRIVGAIFFCQDDWCVNLSDRKISEIVLEIYRRSRRRCRVCHGKLSFDITLTLDGLWSQYVQMRERCPYSLFVLGLNDIDNTMLYENIDVKKYRKRHVPVAYPILIYDYESFKFNNIQNEYNDQT